MLLFSAIITLLIAIFIYLLIVSSSKKNLYKVQLNLSQTKKNISIAYQPKIFCPFIIYSTCNLETQYSVNPGTIIKENLYIWNGKVDVLYENTKIGTIKENEITFNCFDMLEIPNKITKKASTSLLVSKLPKNVHPFLGLKYLDKTCFEPLLKFFHCHSEIVKLENFNSLNFENFVASELNLKNLKLDPISISQDFSLDEKLIYIVSGSLNINGKIFVKNSIFGYIGIFINYYKGFSFSISSSDSAVIIKYIPYSKIKHDHINKKVIKNLSKELIYLGSTLKWNVVEPGFQLFKKHANYDEILIYENVTLGIKECILNQPATDDFFAFKQSNIIKIPKTTIDFFLSLIPSFYSTLIGKIFESPIDQSKVVLITPSGDNCEIFLQRLHKTLFSDSVVVKNTTISEIMGKHAFQNLGD